MIYLYGILRPQEEQDAQRVFVGTDGVGGPVETTERNGLTYIHGRHDGSEILPRRKLLLSHARVLEAAMSFGTVLPMRFGMTCPSVAAFSVLVCDAGERIDAAFDRIEGRIEVGVRVSVSDTAALEAAMAKSTQLQARRDALALKGREAHFAKVDFGRDLGEAVAAERRIAQKKLLASLIPFAIDYIVKAPETDFEILRAEFLVDKACLPEFSDALERNTANGQGSVGGTRLVQLIGPGPAFHFVNVALNASLAEEIA